MRATIDEEEDDSPFLWESIYPQNSSGKPCYHEGGKYVVRLWAAGLWRAVTVDDRIPLDSASRPMLPMSAEPRELWPLLLSKALAKLHHSLCGHDVLGTVGECQDARLAAFCAHRYVATLRSSRVAPAPCQLGARN